MIVIEDKFDIILPYKTYVALGSFDGIHLGHKKLIDKTIQCANESKGKSMICTFKNHPLTIINKDISPKLVMDNETKINCFSKIGLDIVNLAPFDKEYMNIEPQRFAELLIKHYGINGIIVGFNFRFGRKNGGDVNLLKRLSHQWNFSLHIVEPVKIGDQVISSTFIRKLISNGQIEKANSLLYCDFSLKGKVKTGKNFGNTMGFPTANMEFDSDIVIPKVGVYYTRVRYNGIFYKGITNIGYSPTVDGINFTIETHILNFNKNIYGQDIKLYFIKRIRDEVKFNSVNELINQLNRDKIFAEGQ